MNAQKSGSNPYRVRGFPANREIFPRNCPERFRPFVVLLKRTKNTKERKAKHEHIQEKDSGQHHLV